MPMSADRIQKDVTWPSYPGKHSQGSRQVKATFRKEGRRKRREQKSRDGLEIQYLLDSIAPGWTRVEALPALQANIRGPSFCDNTIAPTTTPSLLIPDFRFYENELS